MAQRGESSYSVEVRQHGRDEPNEKAALRQSLLATPRRIPSRYFYDAEGSRLFEEITRLPDYYLTRAEHRLLQSSADEIAATSGAEILMELGSGAATKTRVLLDAMQRGGNLRRYVPFDVSELVVRRVAVELSREYPGLEVHGVVGDFVEHLTHLPQGERRLVIFLGSTIGNFRPDEAGEFLSRISTHMGEGDFFLLGVDLIKPVDRIEAAYNDPAGVTAEFNRNLLRVVNRLFAADFDPGAFLHRAFYDREVHRIEMRLVSTREQRVDIGALDLSLKIGAGEEILTEISTKYDRPGVRAMLETGGFELARWYTDREGQFALALARPR